MIIVPRESYEVLTISAPGLCPWSEEERIDITFRAEDGKYIPMMYVARGAIVHCDSGGNPISYTVQLHLAYDGRFA
jgi:hypothetical protein